MALKDSWNDKVNGKDIVDAEDINSIARAVIEIEERETGGITQETDPTVPAWAKQENKPDYTASEVGAVSQAELEGAIDNALAEAKASGEFDGKDGVSPIVAVTPITGGHRITITDKNGPKTVDVMDGDKGDPGKGITSITRTAGTGAAGTTDTYTIKYTDNTTSTFAVYNGKDGNDGRGIESVVQTTTSSADGGTNVVTITFSDGTKSTFSFKNGSKGSKGDKGDPYTLTEADKAEIVQSVLEGIGSPVYGFIGEDNHITLKGNLPDGTYSVKYEMEDGSTVDIGDLVLEDEPDKPSYTNLAKNFEVGRLNSSGEVSTSSITHENVYTCTDYIGKLTNGDVIRVKGFGTMEYYSTAWYNELQDLYSTAKIPTASELNTAFTYSYDSSTGVATITKINTAKGYSYVRFCGILEGTTDDVIITLNEPIFEPSYTNQIPISTDTDGSVYGFKSDTYISSSSGAVSDKTGICTTGFIPCDNDDVIRFENLAFNANASNGNYFRIAGYDKDKKLIKLVTAPSIAAVVGLEQDSNGVWKKFVLGSNFINTAFIRVCCEGMNENSIITINEEIV